MDTVNQDPEPRDLPRLHESVAKADAENVFVERILAPDAAPDAEAVCERCGRRIERFGEFWRHGSDGSSSPCPRACPSEPGA